jgi:hypothetical protein
MLRVRNKVTGREYRCSEEDFIAARQKTRALIKIGEITPPKKPTPEPKAAKEAKEKKPSKKEK